MIVIKLTKDIQVFGLPSNLIEFVKEDLTVENPEYMNAKIHGRWMGPKLKRFLVYYREHKKKIRLPIGYMDTLMDYVDQYRLDYNIYDQRKVAPVSISFSGSPRTYQKPAIRTMTNHENGILVSSTGSGKTVMGLGIISDLGQKTLIIVHTKDLLQQWVDRCETFLGIDPAQIGRVGGGKFQIGEAITIGIVNTVLNKIDLMRKTFGLVMVDECHRTPGRSFSEAVSEFNSKYKMGLTATAERRDKMTDLIFWYIGPIRYTVREKELKDSGAIMTPQFVIRSTNFIANKDASSQYTHMMKELTMNYSRNRLICRDVYEELKNPHSRCLILSDRKNHCLELNKILLDVFDIESFVLTGDVGDEERAEIIKRIGTDSTPTIATGQLIGEGFDSKALDTLFLTTPIKFSGRVTQYIGRIMRPSPGKDTPLVYDYVDWEISVLRRSALSRIKLYGKSNVIYE